MGVFRDEFTCQKLTERNEDPGRFTRSQWCPEGKCSKWYLIYRWSVALIFLSAILGHIMHVVSIWKGDAWKWVIFMTQQGICLLCIHWIFEAILVTQRYMREKRGSSVDIKELPLSHKISWALANISFNGALFITLIYWVILHAGVADTFESDIAVAFNFFMHTVNTISVIIDFFISDRPWRILDFYYTFIFGTWYLIFSITYWALGGTGFCHLDCGSEGGTEGDVGTENCVTTCDPYIYPILDYGNKLGLSIGFALGGNILLPFLHTFYFLLYQLRLKIFKTFFS
ncbi:protein rolling stone [Lepeophtheirus salmonis]|uniref:protein rolling stone n=1 Tax=Lepeophtheirus salmonis TaxID=72036 RepID=UPI001AE32949|nr:uncharacterized protein LOC121114407 [Lepeophtheirus salmonis]